MKKYKNKRTGKFAYEHLTGYAYETIEGNTKIRDHIPKELVENSCDWEEMIEKKYTILSFIGTLPSNNGLFMRGNDGNYRWESWNVDRFLTEDDMLGKNWQSNYKIHSVRWEPTGEIFTLGDTVKQTNFPSYPAIFVIKEMEIKHDYLIAYGEDRANSGLSLEVLTKQFPKLFTTEDGKDIYNRDRYCYLNPLTDYISSVVTAQGQTAKEYDLPEYKYFSSKEAAETYLINNKKLFSVKDIEEMFDKQYNYKDYIVKKATEIAKTKIQ